MTIALRPLGVAVLAATLAVVGCTDKSTGSASQVAETPIPAPNPGGGGAGETQAVPVPEPAPVDTSKPGGGQAEPVPEPGTMLLFGTGLTGLALWRTRRRRSNAAQQA